MIDVNTPHMGIVVLRGLMAQLATISKQVMPYPYRFNLPSSQIYMRLDAPATRMYPYVAVNVMPSEVLGYDARLRDKLSVILNYGVRFTSLGGEGGMTQAYELGWDFLADLQRALSNGYTITVPRLDGPDVPSIPVEIFEVASYVSQSVAEGSVVEGYLEIWLEYDRSRDDPRAY